MGSHVYSLTIIGYFVPNALSDTMTGNAGETLGGYFRVWYILMRLQFVFVPFVPGH